MMMKTAAILLALAANVSANGGGSLRKAKKNDLTEDIEFWTRMTQAMGSMVSFSVIVQDFISTYADEFVLTLSLFC